MSSDKFLIKLSPKDGYNPVFERGQYNMKLTSFAVLKLAKGEVYKSSTADTEVAFVLLGGKCAMKGDGFDFPEVGGRKNPFDGAPHTVYLPRGISYEITALTDVEIAVNIAPASRDTARPTLITPDMTRSFELGRDNFTRRATVMLDEKFDSEHFYIGEGMIPSGNWSGYPPHRHDIDNLPDEIDMEETYFYPAGFRYPENIHARRTHRRNLHGEKLRHRRNRRRLPPAMRGSRIRHVLPLDNVRTDQQRVDILDGSRA